MNSPTLTKTGWCPIRAVDLRVVGNEPGMCDRCGRSDLRYVHTVAHPDQGQLQVGSECAKRICYGYSPDREERRLRNLWSRRSRWLTRNWATSWKGNETLKFRHDGELVRVTIFTVRFDAVGYCIAVDGDPYYSPEKFATSDAAKLAAFDKIANAAAW